MMSIYRFSFPVLLSVLIVACSSTPEQPEWLMGSDSSYPDSRYLIASGEGSSQSVADNRALANLSKIFQVSVSDSSMDFSQSTVSSQVGNGASQRQVQNDQKVSRFVNTQAQQMLQGAKIAERWQSAQGGPLYSLAVLEKGPAIQRFTQSINSADRDTLSAVNYAQNEAPSAVAALAALEQARQKQVQRMNDNNNLRVLTGSGISTDYDADELTAIIRQSLAKMTMRSSAQDDVNLVMLQSAMADVGVNQAVDGNYNIDMQLEQGASENRQGWLWQRGNLVLSLSDGNTNVATKRWPYKISAQTEAMLVQRLNEKLTNDLPGNIYQLLTPVK
ncbi:hypothetical protein SIN8267_02745 [Sinobacterium norvegicum]|uniref:Lipoprotein LPP20-like domain-containing protein n=1 Tax=Sinobacterium norvegicum TaxID=1641715 RepID=A0ABM9AIK8_9GAMM|nr:LPP20 family lipoprotein [Sinobacterium norvegicum]CAH0992612.1 hypothetical protein SIN8267_02745 [Sinobacterium norvegicum]